MKRFIDVLAAAAGAAERLGREPGGLSLRGLWARAKARLELAANPPLAEALPNPDGQVLASEIQTLKTLLEEIDQLSLALPSDARPMGLAARDLVERSLEECGKPVVNAARLAFDMKQVGALALAMRERLLLAPYSRRTMPS